MQYIQLQGQVASQLDLPLEGSYNLFIDTSDNSIKAKDSDGQLHGGGLSLAELTREEIGHLVASASLTPGEFYKITGAASQSFLDNNGFGWTGYGNEIQDGGTTIILQAATDKTLSKKGIGLFYVPNYENPNVPTTAPDYNYKVWDNTHRLDFSNLNGMFDHNEYVYIHSTHNNAATEGNIVANTGQHSLTFVYDSDNDGFFKDPANFTGLSITGSTSGVSGSIVDYEYTSSYNTGDKVIWGGRVWTNRSGSIGHNQGSWPNTQLTLNPQDWTKVAFNETDYTIVADLIEYEFEVDNISYRRSANNVEVTSIFKIWSDNWGYNMIKYFPWGHTNIQDISISNSYLDAFVNYPHDAYAAQIKFADYGGFNAHYWGRSTSIYNISGDSGAHMVSLNLGYNTQIYDIKLGIESRIADIYTYDNDNGTNALNNITLGNNAQISSNASNTIYMYNSSFMENLELDTNSHISDINLYPYSRIKDTKLGIRSYIESIGLGNYSDFGQVEIGNSSYISYINTDVSSSFNRIKLGIDCNINAIAIDTNGYVKHIELGDQSSMYCNQIGENAYFQYINLGINSEIYLINQTAGNSNFEYIQVGVDSNISNISLGTNSSFNHITLGSNSNINNIDAVSASYAYVEKIDIKNTSYFGSIDMESGSYVRRMDIGTNCDISGLTLTTNTYITDFQFATDSGIGSITLQSGSYLYNFEVGQNSGFGGMDITSSMSDVTISRGFSNLFNTQLQDPSGSNGTTGGRPNINFGDRNIVKFNISGIGTYQGYALPDGDYEGQEITFIVDSDGSHSITPIDIELWSFNIKMTGYSYNVGAYNGAIRPFARLNVTDSGNTYKWKNMSKAVWTGGKWYSDAELYND